MSKDETSNSIPMHVLVSWLDYMIEWECFSQEELEKIKPTLEKMKKASSNTKYRR